MATTPPNLKKLFGDRFRIGHDTAAATVTEKADPWMMTLPCENGVIYPHGPSGLPADCAAGLLDEHRTTRRHGDQLPDCAWRPHLRADARDPGDDPRPEKARRDEPLLRPADATQLAAVSGRPVL
jgi:hypothetical protein